MRPLRCQRPRPDGGSQCKIAGIPGLFFAPGGYARTASFQDELSGYLQRLETLCGPGPQHVALPIEELPKLDLLPTVVVDVPGVLTISSHTIIDGTLFAMARYVVNEQDRCGVPIHCLGHRTRLPTIILAVTAKSCAIEPRACDLLREPGLLRRHILVLIADTRNSQWPSDLAKCALPRLNLLAMEVWLAPPVVSAIARLLCEE